MTTTSTLPVAVIGAGPTGLAAAAHLIERGETPVVFEAGNSVGANILKWGHVRMFSPWMYNVDAAAARLLEASGFEPPDPDALPTGREYVEQYLAPLASVPVARARIHLRTRAVAVTREAADKVMTTGREQVPFVVHVQRPDGTSDLVRARAVLDASGTYATPNPLGASGIPATGEVANSDHIAYGMPDVLGADRARYAGKRTLVVGSGHSAANVLVDLAVLAEETPGTEIMWVLRKASPVDAFGGQELDALPARGALGIGLRQLIGRDTVHVMSAFRATRVERTARGVVVHGTRRGEPVSLAPVDEIVVATGARPDLSVLREVRVDLDPALESVRALAPLVDPNIHSCGTIRPHGEAELQHPEPGLYIVGMKSYGRAPGFLTTVGHEQVRSVVAALTGDWKAARSVELELPETGVCGSGSTSCCSAELTPAAALQRAPA